jgi:hypothetical protein
VPEFEFGLEEVALQPIDGGRSKFAVPNCLSASARNCRPWCKDRLVVPKDLTIADLRIYERHRCAAVAEDRHNRMKLGAAFGELRAYGVPETVYVNRSAASRIDKSCGDTCFLERFLE